MEPEIRADLPASSPIVAYGATRQPGGKKFLAILAGSFVLVLIGTALWAAISWHIPFPKNVVALASIHGGTELPSGLPIIWQQAARAHHPVVLGLTTSEMGPTPFAVTLWLDEPVGISHIDAWPFVISSDAPLTMDEQKPVRGILWLTLLLGRHTAFLSISPSTLTHDAGEMMSGPLDGATWHTDVELSATNNASLPPGDISMDLDALPDAWTLMRDAIQASQPLLTLDERPTDIGWSMTTGTPSIVARYDTSPSTSTMLAFANAAGIFDETPLTLPDGSIAEELGPPIQELMTSGTIRTTSSSSTKLLIEQNTVFLGPPDADNRTNTQCISSPGIFALSRRLIQMHFPALDFGVRAFVEQGHLVVETCDSQ